MFCLSLNDNTLLDEEGFVTLTLLYSRAALVLALSLNYMHEPAGLAGITVKLYRTSFFVSESPVVYTAQCYSHPAWYVPMLNN